MSSKILLIKDGNHPCSSEKDFQQYMALYLDEVLYQGALQNMAHFLQPSQPMNTYVVSTVQQILETQYFFWLSIAICLCNRWKKIFLSILFVVVYSLANVRLLMLYLVKGVQEVWDSCPLGVYQGNSQVEKNAEEFTPSFTEQKLF